MDAVTKVTRKKHRRGILCTKRPLHESKRVSPQKQVLSLSKLVTLVTHPLKAIENSFLSGNQFQNLLVTFWLPSGYREG